MGSFSEKTVLLTGGAGFLGKRLSRRLVDLYARVHLIVRPSLDHNSLSTLDARLQLHHADLADLGSLTGIVARVRPDIVFHLAATGGHKNANALPQLFRDNVLATSNLLRATAPLRDCRLIHAGGALETGAAPVPVQEGDPVAPVTPYALTKAAATLLVRQAARDTGRAIVLLKPFSIYGPGEPGHRLVPTAIRAGFSGTTLPLTEPGYTRDFVFVDDVVDAFVTAAVRDGIAGEMFNIATGRATANEDVVALIEKHVGRRIDVAPGAYPPRATDTAFWCADVTKARRLLGWEARHSLDEGIAATVAWFRQHAAGGQSLV